MFNNEDIFITCLTLYEIDQRRHMLTIITWLIQLDYLTGLSMRGEIHKLPCFVRLRHDCGLVFARRERHLAADADVSCRWCKRLFYGHGQAILKLFNLTVFLLQRLLVLV